MSTRLEPVKYRVLGIPTRFNAGEYEPNPYIEERRQRDGTVLWVVTDFGLVLNRDGEWEWEPQPSSRDDDFVARTRYASVDEALAAVSR